MSVTTVGVMSRPDPEVRPAARVYSAAFKAEVLAELDAADSRTERGEIIRRHGLYSQLIHHWRGQRDRAGLEGLKDRKRGPKTDPARILNERLTARVVELEARLATAEELIEAQGKVSALLQQHSRKSAETKRP
jgi:transposase-like protein